MKLRCHVAKDDITLDELKTFVKSYAEAKYGMSITIHKDLVVLRDAISEFVMYNNYLEQLKSTYKLYGKKAAKQLIDIYIYNTQQEIIMSLVSNANEFTNSQLEYFS